VTSQFSSQRAAWQGEETVSLQPQEIKKKRKILSLLLAVLGFFTWGKLVPPAMSSPMAASSDAIPADGSCTANNADTQYLLFWPPLPGATPEGLGESIRAFAAKLGTTGDGKTRQLGFGAFIPIFASDESIIAKAINLGFMIAQHTNVAVLFLVDDHILWDGRPDLWNWYDPSKPGYNPDNRKNVEWYDWEGTPNKRRYFTPAGAPSQAPHMCYNSPVIEKEVTRIVSQIVGPALREQINELKRDNKEYLFAGITVGAEAGFDDYSKIPKISRIPSTANPMQMQLAKMLMLAAKMMDEDHAPHSRVGYCSLTNAGYSKTNPPPDFNAALAEVNQKFLEFWDKQFVDAGIPCSRLYTHVAASPPQDDTNNAPLQIVFNPYVRPGWTTYPQGTLANGFEPLYDQLERHGNPAWGGVEANDVPNRVSWETYLAWHFNHGAKLVGINSGTSDQAIASVLARGAFSDEALSAYLKFLRGGNLVER
jgi:hypothetical protein